MGYGSQVNGAWPRPPDYKLTSQASSCVKYCLQVCGLWPYPPVHELTSRNSPERVHNQACVCQPVQLIRSQPNVA
eukprot:354043-Chlamydomonas_euryale.AAC.5